MVLQSSSRRGRTPPAAASAPPAPQYTSSTAEGLGSIVIMASMPASSTGAELSWTCCHEASATLRICLSTCQSVAV